MRRFHNVLDVAIDAPTLHLSIAPGETADIDIPADQPCPFGLEEVTTKAARAAADSPAQPATKER